MCWFCFSSVFFYRYFSSASQVHYRLAVDREFFPNLSFKCGAHDVVDSVVLMLVYCLVEFFLIQFPKRAVFSRFYYGWFGLKAKVMLDLVVFGFKKSLH